MGVDIHRVKVVKVNRSYKLRLYGNDVKTDTVRYAHSRFLQWCQMWSGRLLFNGNKYSSTQGLGSIAHKAQYKAKGIISALKAAAKETGNKTNIPNLKNVGMPAKIETSKTPSFDYWVRVGNEWTKKGVVRLPAKAHKALNKALKEGWKLSSQCEVKPINGEWFALLFVSKEVEKATAQPKSMGADVGINKAVTTSDGYKGTDLKPIIDKVKESGRERYRQRMKFKQIQTLKRGKKDKSIVKQILDLEAKLFMKRLKKSGANAVVESRKSIANLRSGRLAKWARCYFANRMETLCKENSVFFLEVSPWKSSLTCASCGEEGKRQQEVFVCSKTSCSEYLREADADLNASRELRNRGHLAVERYFSSALRGV